ncbi:MULTISPECIES: hypothetical protein [unclassified Arthrobacter]|uniref:hypothetical protein n=1 Tax=unclassified Arthrobacter TaxID=235627 RepID=UPI000CE55460|nr:MULTISPECIES: hypothetical protein [unclassified Arthrobacter]
MSNQDHVQTGRFYTAARKFQQLIGVTPAGEAIPGGPYTVTQFIVGIVTVVVGFISRPLWTQGAITDVLFIAAAAVGITYGVGRMPGSRRSIINLINCSMALMLRPRTGKYRGQKLPATYSKTKPKKKPKKAPAATAPETDATDSGHRNGPAIEHVQINSGLDRLTADLTTAR